MARTLLGVILTFGLQVSLRSDPGVEFAGLNEVDERCGCTRCVNVPIDNDAVGYSRAHATGGRVWGVAS